MSVEALRRYAGASVEERCRMIRDHYAAQAEAAAQRRARLEASGYAGCGAGIVRPGWGVPPAIFYWNRNW